MFNYRRNILFILFTCSAFLFTSCIEDELAFEVLESPVLAVFEDMTPDETSNFKVKATFYDLDKSNILDVSKGIDSIPISNLSIQVFVLESNLIGNLTTDSNGEITFEAPFEDLLGSTQLEWVGNYENVPFRIYKKL